MYDYPDEPEFKKCRENDNFKVGDIKEFTLSDGEKVIFGSNK